MKSIKNKFSALLVLVCIQFSFAQDSLKLSHQEFLNIVKNYHPLAFRYQLQNKIANAEITKARGNFDPVIAGKLGEKNIDGTKYYEQKNVELGIPTWYGIDITGSYNYLDGEKLNSSETKGGLYQFGVTVPLAKNLLYDKRRAMLDQAKFGLKMTEAEQTVLTNELLLDAENTYWEWVKTYEIYKLQKSAVEINRQRLELTKKTYQYGERPAIDTVEAASQLQSFELQERDAYLGFVKSTQEMQIYLWRDNQEFFEISQLIFPSSDLDEHSGYKDYEFLIESIQAMQLQNHASLEYYFQKQNILESERRLKWQSFLPKLDFTYNFFNKENYKSEFLPLFDNNFQYGLKLEIPVFQRQARADYEIAKLKISQNQQDSQVKLREIQTKIEIYKNEISNYFTQIDISTKNLINYQRLLNAEEMRFSNGESSLFLINSRETKLLEATEKNIELKAKFLKSYNKLKWLNENFLR
ncbi:Outer membrane protein TolC [Chryseobacterium sp. RU37D]|uniref:TolC family protein n=1 Tax=Chryseobacterium sp. RU37D TaxID=1907397 RepID=UPI0009552268|nr:TolC family protein [Chryseobacterium sp. RU37D]SIQ55391.1 Outer membrane protein TolC [Chryseobacterium sp. RU37D]